MDAISVTQLYDRLSKSVGKETAEGLTTFIENKIKKDMESNVHMLATKKDIADLKGETIKWIAELRGDTITWINELKGESMKWINDLKHETQQSIATTHQRIEELRAETHKIVAETKASMVRWMFLFWVGQIAVTFSIVLPYLKN